MGAALKQMDVLSDPAQAAVLLDPVRLRLVGALREPDSASGVARRLGLPRQKVNYHLRELERFGLVELVEERRKGNCTERIVRSVASSYLINPEVLGEVGPRPEGVRDRLSWAYLMSLAARTIRELAVLRERADRVDQRLATMGIDAEVRFADAAQMTAFADELTRCVAGLVAKYHNASAPDGRCYRFILGAHPSLTKSEEDAAREAREHDAARDRDRRGHTT